MEKETHYHFNDKGVDRNNVGAELWLQKKETCCDLAEGKYLIWGEVVKKLSYLVVEEILPGQPSPGNTVLKEGQKLITIKEFKIIVIKSS